MHRFAILMGNGPSLKDLDFGRLIDFDTLGMNAAYRHWDRILWYPAHYACLDDQLIETHHDEIVRLRRTTDIRSFFVHGRFFELHPECIGDPAFVSLDQALPHWFNKRAKGMGFDPLYEHPAFRCSDTTKVTTGAYALRYLAYLGYPAVALMGIDLKYVEFLPEAKRSGDYGLVMQSTPSENPNYFFPDYQRAGDRYNVPNPDVHQGDLHPRSFEVVRDDFLRNNVKTIVVNTNPRSVLEDRKIFPLLSRDEVLEISPLGSVVVPATVGETDQIVNNFRLWNDPRFMPSKPRSRGNPKLIVCFNKEPGRDSRDTLDESFMRHRIGRFFDGLTVVNLGLDGERDIYRRDYKGPVGVEGFKAGPNNQFFLTMEAVRDIGRYCFLMETDCAPIKPGWLDHLGSLISKAPPFWIMGSAYRGVANVSPSFRRHINGNAVYAAGDSAFQDFLSCFWLPRLRRAVERDDRKLAYDCILERSFADQGDQEAWKTWQANAHRFIYTDFIQNLSGKEDLAKSPDEVIRSVEQTSPGTFIVHNRTVSEYLTAQLSALSSR